MLLLTTSTLSGTKFSALGFLSVFFFFSYARYEPLGLCCRIVVCIFKSRLTLFENFLCRTLMNAIFTVSCNSLKPDCIRACKKFTDRHNARRENSRNCKTLYVVCWKQKTSLITSCRTVDARPLFIQLFTSLLFV